MENPFISYYGDHHAQYLTQNCSLNRMVVAKLPLDGVEDGLAGKTADKIFSTSVLIQEIKIHAHSLRIDTAQTPRTKLPFVLEERLTDKDEQIAGAADELVKKFGYRLGLIFLTLKKGERENRAARDDWDDSHWDYWAKLKTVILVGGLANGLLGRRLKKYALRLFKKADVAPYNFVLFENASFVGVMGCASKITKRDGVNAVFDFGQTSIKRCIVKKASGEIGGVITLPSYESKYMDSHMSNPQQEHQAAVSLNKYLINLILETCREAEKYGELNDEILISIASYTVAGKLNAQRGGYAKLTPLCKNYAECLSEELSGRLKHKVRVTLIHDATAVALYFNDYKDAVCITMGTAFGVGFPDIVI